MQREARARVTLLPTVRHGKEKPLQHQRKGNAGLSFASFCCSLVRTSMDLCSCKWYRLHSTCRIFLYCFHTENLCKKDFGCTTADADQPNGNHEVCRWWSQGCNWKISYSIRNLYLGSNCYSVPTNCSSNNMFTLEFQLLGACICLGSGILPGNEGRMVCEIARLYQTNGPTSPVFCPNCCQCWML